MQRASNSIIPIASILKIPTIERQQEFELFIDAHFPSHFCLNIIKMVNQLVNNFFFLLYRESDFNYTEIIHKHILERLSNKKLTNLVAL